MNCLSAAIAVLLLMPAITTHGRNHDVPADKMRNIRPQSPPLPQTTAAPSSQAAKAPFKKSTNAGRPPGTTRKPRGPTMGPETISPPTAAPTTAMPTFIPCGTTAVDVTIVACVSPSTSSTNVLLPPCPCLAIDQVDFHTSFTDSAIVDYRLNAWGFTDVKYGQEYSYIYSGTTDPNDPNFPLDITCGASNPVLFTALDINGDVVCTQIFNFQFV